MGPNANSPGRQPQDIVVIGGSAGSLRALKTILGGLPNDFPGSIFVVIHVSADSPELLDEHLAQCGSLPVRQPRDQEAIRTGHIYAARPDYHLTIESGMIRVRRGPRENRHRPAIDPLFRSAARVYGPRAIGVVLSGLLDDGSAGLYAVKQRGGVAIVQDPKESAWDEMPRHAIQYSSPHYLLPTWEIAPSLIQLVEAHRDEPVMPNKNPHHRNSHKNPKRTTGSAASDKPEQNLKTSYFDEGEGRHLCSPARSAMGCFGS